MNALFERAQKRAVILPLFLYDHSGITMNTTGFHCPWDSGQVGYIYVTLENIRREHSVKRVPQLLRERIAKHLIQEVKVYDHYLTGNCYGFVVEKDDEEIDSCWGFLGDYDGYCLEEAKAWNALIRVRCVVGRARCNRKEGEVDPGRASLPPCSRESFRGGHHP